MNMYYSPEETENHRVLPTGLQEDITQVALTSEDLSTEGEPEVAVLTGLQVDGSAVNVHWTFGQEGHAQVLAQLTGEPASSSVINHELTLGDSEVLHVGALASVGRKAENVLSELCFMSESSQKDPDSSELTAAPLSDQARQLLGQITLASAEHLMDKTQQDSCDLVVELHDGDTTRTDFMEYGVISRSE